MAGKTVDAEFICTVLQEQGLLNSDQAQDILLQEEKHRRLLQTKLAQDAKSSGIQRQPGDDDISVVDVINFMRMRPANNDREVLTEEMIMKALAAYWKLPFLKLDPLKLKLEVVTSKISEPFAIKHVVVPVQLDEEKELMTVAVVNPWDVEALETVRRVAGMKVQPVISTKSDILKIIREFHGFRTSVKAAERTMADRINFSSLEQYTDVNVRYTDKHIVNAVNLFFNYAFEQRASDIHIEPKHSYSQIRIRIDGILHNIHRMSRTVNAAVCSRIKMLARMDISEKRKPQDGRIKTRFQGRDVELRVSTMPVAYDEKIVIRILDRGSLVQDIKHVGFTQEEEQQYLSFISKSNGIILITGPTGSGKTTTLYSTLDKLSSEEINIMTIEDPIEMIHEDINQIAVRQNVGLTFGTALRNIVRQDPDVIMVGEIRDHETVENAIHAALTGHLVLSTLHTNDAPSAIARLVDMGAEPFLVESTLIAVLAQRLVRLICDVCGEDYTPTDNDLAPVGITTAELNGKQLRRGVGCSKCRNTGYYGRSAIFEIMPVSHEIRQLIHRSAGSQDIQAQALKEGMHTLWQSGVKKLISGQTTIEEVVRVTGTHHVEQKG